MTEFYLFGSVATGDVDPGSDVDILAILEDPVNRQRFPRCWSVYTKDRIRNLYARGTLFAWHIFQDAILLYPRETNGFLKSLGSPNPYTGAPKEVACLKKLAKQAVIELKGGTPSPVYELGILYLSARDIAMAASIHILGQFTFSRFAPFYLPEMVFPLQRTEYEHMMNCRRASLRGTPPPVDAGVQVSVAEKLDALLSWCNSVERRILSCGDLQAR